MISLCFQVHKCWWFFLSSPFCLVSRHYSKLACVICANCPRGFLKSIQEEVCQRQHLIQQVVVECYIPRLHALMRRRNLPLSNGVSAQALAACLQEQGGKSGEFCMWDTSLTESALLLYEERTDCWIALRIFWDPSVTAPLRPDTPEEADALFPTALAFRPWASGRKQLSQLDLQTCVGGSLSSKRWNIMLKGCTPGRPQVGFLGSRFFFICYTFNPLIRNLNLDSSTLRKIFLLLISNSLSYRSAFITRTGLERDRHSGRLHHQASESWSQDKPVSNLTLLKHLRCINVWVRF